ncbi:glycoside hydrolase family 32 protein [Lederbergia citrea]|uniref:glycoside hydrolase family 32 protein n=1 Tax=Lederbergia citrea TaxID=2833581 RepID=UPI001BC94C41|nr:glycoside hydrolase family 32 protein [Lederbergia citrea]MBS4178138.1 glycoside hydrolase family 32 protein [Lederbergia citrea]
MNKLEAANHYIEKNKGTVKNRPYFHFTPEIGWMNDPNGFSFYKGAYHLFYQHNPYDVVWHNMHWGHATTKDFVNWNYQPVALANDKIYDANGCFSGSAIEKDGKLYLLYTGHIDPNIGFEADETQVKQYQCIAVSEDGVNFEKHENNPVISEKELPEGYMICDFRDPKVWEVHGVYYCVIVVRNSERRGEILMFKSHNLIEWTFYSSIFQMKYEDHILLECPDFFHIDGKDVLVFSIMPCDPEYKEDVANKTAYAIGKLDYVEGRFIVESEGLLDYGPNFYAPQTTEGENGERLLIAWMQRWNQATPPKDFAFNGMMSLPRELTIKDNCLIQQPVKTIENYFKNSKLYENIQVNENEEFHLKNSKTAHIKLIASTSETNQFLIELNKSEKKSTRIKVDVEGATISLQSDYSDEDQIVIKDVTGTLDGDLTLDLYIDLYSIELFINSGEKVLSFTSYEEKGNEISIRGISSTLIKKVVYAPFEKCE